jgi:fluoride ion exporter CrcB/FEX
LEQWVRQLQQQPGCQRVIVGAMGAAIAARTRCLLEQWLWQSQQQPGFQRVIVGVMGAESGRRRLIVGAMGAAIAATTRLSKSNFLSDGYGNRSKYQAIKG